MKTKRRIVYVILGAAQMALNGVLYAWTNYAEIIRGETSWSFEELSLVFTIWSISMAVGSLLSGFLMRRFRARAMILTAAILGAAGIAASTLVTGGIWLFYVLFGVCAGVAIGMVGVPIFSSVLSWFPDRVGVVSGIMMMGLGVGTLGLGAGASELAKVIGWRPFFRIYALLFLVLLCLCALLLRQPREGEVAAAPENGGEKRETGRSYTSGQMLARVSFWIFFFWASFGYMGNVIVSAHANQMAQQLQTSTWLAGVSVGIHHVFCAIGSVVLGGIYDRLGARKTILVMNILLLGGALCFVGADALGSVPLFVAGLVILGLAAGGIPSVCSAHVMAFYGPKYYPSNYAIIGQRALLGSVGSWAAAAIYTASGGYLLVYLAYSGVLALFFLLSSLIRRP